MENCLLKTRKYVLHFFLFWSLQEEMKFLFIRSSDIQSCFFGRDSGKENLPRIFLSDFCRKIQANKFIKYYM